MERTEYVSDFFFVDRFSTGNNVKKTPDTVDLRFVEFNA